jgi:hypothetical protein
LRGFLKFFEESGFSDDTFTPRRNWLNFHCENFVSFDIADFIAFAESAGTDLSDNLEIADTTAGRKAFVIGWGGRGGSADHRIWKCESQ